MANQNGRGGWLPYLGVITLVAGIVYQSGAYSHDLSDARTDIDKLQSRVEKLEEMNNRLTRIETKIDMMLPERKGQP